MRFISGLVLVNALLAAMWWAGFDAGHKAKQAEEYEAGSEYGYDIGFERGYSQGFRGGVSQEQSDAQQYGVCYAESHETR